MAQVAAALIGISPNIKQRGNHSNSARLWRCRLIPGAKAPSASWRARQRPRLCQKRPATGPDRNHFRAIGNAYQAGAMFQFGTSLRPRGSGRAGCIAGSGRRRCVLFRRPGAASWFRPTEPRMTTPFSSAWPALNRVLIFQLFRLTLMTATPSVLVSSPASRPGSSRAAARRADAEEAATATVDGIAEIGTEGKIFAMKLSARRQC